MSKPRKKYRQRAVDPTAGFRLLMRASTDAFTDDQITDLCLMNSAALDDLTRGRADACAIGVLGNACNVALVLAEAGFGAEYVGTIQSAGDALVVIEDRRAKLGRYVATGPELIAIRALVEIHEAQITSEDCQTGYVVQAIDEVRRRMAQGEVQAA